jgi:hypothetical protein
MCCGSDVMKPDTITISSPSCAHTVAIVEPRQHNLLGATIENALEYSSAQWCVQVFHGKTADVSGMPQHARLSYHALDTDNLDAAQYNALLRTPEFWGRMRGTEKVLIMQTDSAFCGHPDSPSLDQTPAYGYIGCSSDVSGWGGKCRGIGGFSLRDKETMLQCARELDGGTGGEDVYFAACGLQKSREGGKPMPEKNSDMWKFCVEYVEEVGTSHADLKPPPLGVHVSNISDKTWAYIHDSCPAAQHLYDDKFPR